MPVFTDIGTRVSALVLPVTETCSFDPAFQGFRNMEVHGKGFFCTIEATTTIAIALTVDTIIQLHLLVLACHGHAERVLEHCRSLIGPSPQRLAVSSRATNQCYTTEPMKDSEYCY